AGARRGRAGQPLPAGLRDRRVPLHLLRLLPGGVPRGGHPRGRALRELGVLARRLRVRPGAADEPEARGQLALGSRRHEGPVVREIIFYAAAVVAIASGVLCITRRSPVASALWLVNVLFNLSVLYVLLDAQFIAAVQVLVYAGAIMVL